MVVRETKRKDFYGVCARICGVPCALVHRGGNGQYEAVFQRCDASLEDIEGIDWAQPVVTVHLRTARQFLGDVTGYQAQVEELAARAEEKEKTIQAQAETIRELESRPDSGAELEAELERAYAEGVESNG